MDYSRFIKSSVKDYFDLSKVQGSNNGLASKSWMYKSKAFVPPRHSDIPKTNSNIDILISACKLVFGEVFTGEPDDLSSYEAKRDIHNFETFTGEAFDQIDCVNSSDEKENWCVPDVSDSFLELESSYLASSPKRALSVCDYNHSNLVKEAGTRSLFPCTALEPLCNSSERQSSSNASSRRQKRKAPFRSVKKLATKSASKFLESKHSKAFTSSLPSHAPCVSCKGRKSPCWRPSWSINAGQLCNSCGLRFRKTRIRCIECLYIPAKIELVPVLQDSAKLESMECPKCTRTLRKD